MKVRSAAAAAAIATVLVCAGCASMSGDDAARAPEPAKPIDASRFYAGRWYEIARTPMSITTNCVAGVTDYTTGTDGVVIDRDSCRMGTPEGHEKAFAGPVTILNPGDNTKVRVDYKVFKIFDAPRTYWMLDHDESYRWFIVSDPGFKSLSLFTRDPRPSPELVAQLTARIARLGYPTSKLEYPAQFAPGER
jgi:apolipoprotein D and lipocalin family protein